MLCSYIPLHELPPQPLYDIWTKLLPFVKKLESRSGGRLTEKSLLEECMTQEAQLWVVFEDDESILSFIVTKIRQYPKKRLLSFEYIGGDEVDRWLQMAHDYISKWGREMACDGVEAIGRVGWVRLLKPMGWQQRYVLYERMFEQNDVPIQE